MGNPSLPPDLDAYKPDRDDTPGPLDPDKIRVVDVETESSGSVLRFDCYEPSSEKKMFRLVGDQVEVRAIDWARSRELDADVEIEWKSTGRSSWDVDQIRVFTWPAGELVRVYKDVE